MRKEKMKKSVQLEINKEVKEEYDYMLEILTTHGHTTWKKLRSCNAEVCETAGLYVLRSYNTIVACIDVVECKCYDFLRMVYGYTSTSAQHISKFNHDYGKECGFNWGCPIVRYYEV